MRQHPTLLEKEREKNDWLIASVDILKPAIDNKRKANLANKQRATRATLQEAKEARKTTRRLVRQATNKYWTDLADRVQYAADNGNICQLVS